MRVIEGNTADELWCNVRDLFANSELSEAQSSRCGPCHDIGHVTLKLADPRQRWVLSRAPAINPAFALAECIWILCGRNDLKFLHYFNKQYCNYVGKAEQVYGAYGFRLRRHLGIDQIGRAYHALQSNPSSRQVVLQIWDALSDMPAQSGQPASQDIPCNLVSLLKVRNGSLEWTQILRSNDIFLGLPYNMLQFTTIQEVMCGWLGLRLGTYYHVTDSLHCYKDNMHDVTTSESKPISINSDSLMFSREIFDNQFGELARRIEELIATHLSKSKFLSLMDWKDADQAVLNILYVLGAECARRRKWGGEQQESISKCTNPVYTRAFAGWVETLKAI